MGGDTLREPVHHGLIVHHDLERIRQVLPALYVHSHRAGPSCRLCRGAVQNVGKSFLKGYAAVCLEGAVIVLGCIIFSIFVESPPVVDSDAAAVTQVWSYVGELIFDMLVLVGAIKMSDRVVREMMGL